MFLPKLHGRLGMQVHKRGLHRWVPDTRGVCLRNNWIAQHHFSRCNLDTLGPNRDKEPYFLCSLWHHEILLQSDRPLTVFDGIVLLWTVDQETSIGFILDD